ncbi:MAG: 3',5'-cyclic adenosine monophosphate phosphodiesterase CpdA [Gemmatimonadaceae bacterium]|nr:3',5'-cyclic adenosine monophosphate phosphodiesterase CpdA [Gemmatimonadaceae bacterium]
MTTRRPGVSILHVSDVHFGASVVHEQVEAIEALVHSHPYDAIALSGDLSLRARAGELQRARAFVRDLRRASPVIVVPGNHDVAWWRSPLHLRGSETMYAPYLRHTGEELEPVLRVPGATLVGLNTAQGVHARTLTWNLRDLSIIGDLRPTQLAAARQAFVEAPEDDLRVVVLHHNLTRGDLSRRFGVKRAEQAVDALAHMGVDLVLTGHDHQEAVHAHAHAGRTMLVLTAGTISSRSRGGRPSSVHEIVAASDRIEVVTRVWAGEGRGFEPLATQCFAR